MHEPLQTTSGAPTTAAVTTPEFVRLPRPGFRCPVTGLSRSTLNELVLPSAANEFRPPVRSHVLRKSGSLRGIRLISLRSLLDHIQAQSEKASHE